MTRKSLFTRGSFCHRHLNQIAIHGFCWFNILICLLFFPACEWDDHPASTPDEVILNQRIRSKIQTLDPADVGDTASHGVCSEFYESLYSYHYLKRPHKIVPELAVAMPETSEDGMTYRIPVKKDIIFHDDPCFPDGNSLSRNCFNNSHLFLPPDFLFSVETPFRGNGLGFDSRSWFYNLCASLGKYTG